MERLFHRNGRVLLTRLLARLHGALAAAAVCALVGEILGADGLTVWLRTLLLAIPLSLSRLAVDHLRTLAAYALASAGITLLGGLLTGHWAGAALTLLACLIRGRARLFQEPQPALLERPTPWAFAVFGAVLVFSALLDRPVSQRLAALSAVLYLLVWVAFQGLARLEEYLTLNREIANLPTMQIRRITGGALLAVLVILGAVLLPGALGVRGDWRLDLPQRSRRSSGVLTDVEIAETLPASGAEMLTRLFGEREEREVHGEIIVAVTLAAAAVLGLAAVVRLLRHFRGTFAEGRDEVQALREEPDFPATAERAGRRERVRLLDRSPNAVIRRTYRRRVRRGGGELPRPWQTPAEIEAGAGVEDPVLHGLYERARYGPAPCTAEDLRTLRRERRG